MIISRIILSALAGYLAYLALAGKIDKDRESAFVGIIVCLLTFISLTELFERIL